MVSSEYPFSGDRPLIYCDAQSREEEKVVTIFRFALKRVFGNTTNLIFLTIFPIACIFLPKGEGVAISSLWLSVFWNFNFVYRHSFSHHYFRGSRKRCG